MVLKLAEGSLTFREFAMHEPHPLAVVHAEILLFLRGRDDAVLFGAQAVNVHVSVSRMTEDVDILSTNAAALAEELRAHLGQRFGFAARTRVVAEGLGFRVYQRRKDGNRHLADVRQVEELPPSELAEGVRVPAVAVLVAQKVRAYAVRRNRLKGGTDWRDLVYLLTEHPHLKVVDGEVRAWLHAGGATAETMSLWRQVVATEIEPDGEDDDLTF